MTPAARLDTLLQDGTDGDDVFTVTAEELFEATFDGLGGTDTAELIGGGNFDLSSAVLSSIEIVRGSTEDDTILLAPSSLAGLTSLEGAGGTDVLQLSGNISNAFDFSQTTVSGFSRLEVTSKGFAATFTDKATALLVWATRSQNDTLTLVGRSFTDAEREQLHRQGVDTIIDETGASTNEAPRLSNLNQDKVYTSNAKAFLDWRSDAIVGPSDDAFKSLTVGMDEFDPSAWIDIVAQGKISLPDGTDAGATILYDGTVIGTLDRTDTTLEITFTNDATSGSVEALVHALAYVNRDPDRSLVKTSILSLSLSDEGGRTVLANLTVSAGGENVQFLTPDGDPSTPDREADLLIGTADDDTFATDAAGVGAGDVVLGGGGVDTLALVGGGAFNPTSPARLLGPEVTNAFDLTPLAGFSGVEIIKGTSQNDDIKLDAAHLKDVTTIDGGPDDGETSVHDSIAILGDLIDLRGKTLTSIEGIKLLTDEAIVKVDDKAIAVLLDGLASARDHVILSGQTFTEAERALLFQHHIETISDASGTYSNRAPVLNGLGGDRTVGTGAAPIFIDAGRNATLSDEDGRLSTLSVSVVDGTAFDKIALAPGGRINLTQVDGFDRISVDGVDIGFVLLASAGSPRLDISFNSSAAPELAQEVLRAITYRNTSDHFNGQRKIKVRVDDITSHVAEVSVFVEAAIKPSAIQLSNASIKEVAADGSVIGTLTATDSNTGDAVSFQLLNDAGGRFALEGGRLIVKEGVKLDYEQAKSHQVVVRATDKHGLFLDQTFTIGVQDVAKEVVIGTSHNDVAVGGRGNDTFYGKLGRDTFTGGRGKDVFAFDTKPDRSNVDTIKDFRPVDDTISLARSVFSTIGRKGDLSKDAFWIGARAHDGSDRIIYNDKTGSILYDSDGSGRLAAAQIAILQKNLRAISEKDFLIV
jgi:serralysin